ncbi:hypothetical protein WJX77_010425 [Trebouxia sp. C0004]
MLARLIRSPGLQIASVKNSAVPDSTEIWPQDLKAQMLQYATNIRFRYEMDSHKLHSDTTLDRAEKAIGYQFLNRQLLRLALTHSSASAQNNISLSWIGDSVLQLVVSEGLLSRYPEASIGDLAKLRSVMIGRASCCKRAQQLGLQKWLIVGNDISSIYSGENCAELPYPSSILSESYEAVLGAVYTDAGLERSHVLFAKHIVWPANLTKAIKRFMITPL